MKHGFIFLMCTKIKFKLFVTIVLTTFTPLHLTELRLYLTSIYSVPFSLNFPRFLIKLKIKALVLKMYQGVTFNELLLF